MKILCCSIKLQKLVKITDKCYKAREFDGRETLLPASQVFGEDYSTTNAWWISAWIISRKNLQWDSSKEAWIDRITRQAEPVHKKRKIHLPHLLEVPDHVEIEHSLQD